MRLFGASPGALRLPSVLAVWVGLVCVYRVVARSLGSQYAFGATLLFLIVGGYEAALRPRGYALLLASFGLTLMLWQRIATGQARALDRVFFIGGLVTAFYSHYYGVLHRLAFFVDTLHRAT